MDKPWTYLSKIIKKILPISDLFQSLQMLNLHHIVTSKFLYETNFDLNSIDHKITTFETRLFGLWRTIRMMHIMTYNFFIVTVTDNQDFID